MAALDIQRGRDAFFDLLRRHQLLVPVKRNRRRTTFAGLWHCPNLTTELTLERPGQLWVADITDLTTEQGFLYLALLTDAFSSFVVGYDLSSSLATEGTLRALDQALAQTGQTTDLIHHSDHGVQYTAYSYRERLQQHLIRSSITVMTTPSLNASMAF